MKRTLLSRETTREKRDIGKGGARPLKNGRLLSPARVCCGFSPTLKHPHKQKTLSRWHGKRAFLNRGHGGKTYQGKAAKTL